VSMNGQWVGPYSGTNVGTAVVDLDDAKSCYQGVVFAYDNNVGVPHIFAHVEIPKDKNKFSLRLGLEFQERGTGNFFTKENIAQRFPDLITPTYADTNWEIVGDKIIVDWTTDIGTNGRAEVVRRGGSPSRLIPFVGVNSWDEFKKFVLAPEPFRHVFRGHERSTWRLRTSFHRSGRSSLLKFVNQDVPALHRHLSGLTSHHFNLGDPFDYAAFLNLVQHHGYPTPLLDWTQSPFVAAYFAFRDLRLDQITADQKVRILILDAMEWNVLGRAPNLMPGYLHMTLLEPLSTNNTRVVPQQSDSRD
jgi:hypothetical protein